MIRKFENADINEIADIWLDTNIKAHNFIPSRYWQENFKTVKAMLSESEIYVYENEETNKIQGFIGLSNDYIEGLFIYSKVQSNGIGKQLLDFAKESKSELSLSVYEKNIRAVRFYQRENFIIHSEDIDRNTNEKEYTMIWKR